MSYESLDTNATRLTLQLKNQTWELLSEAAQYTLSTEQIVTLYNSNWNTEPGYPTFFKVKIIVKPNNPFELTWFRFFDGIVNRYIEKRD